MEQKNCKNISIEIEATVVATDEYPKDYDFTLYNDFPLVPSITALEIEVTLSGTKERKHQRNYDVTIETCEEDTGRLISTNHQTVTIEGGTRWGSAKISLPISFEQLADGQRFNIRAYLDGNKDRTSAAYVRLLRPASVANWCAIESAGWHMERRTTIYSNPDFAKAEYQILQFIIKGNLKEEWQGVPPAMQLIVRGSDQTTIRTVYPRLLVDGAESRDGMSRWIVEGGFWLCDENSDQLYAELACMNTHLGGFACDASLPPVKGAVSQHLLM